MPAALFDARLTSVGKRHRLIDTSPDQQQTSSDEEDIVQGDTPPTDYCGLNTQASFRQLKHAAFFLYGECSSRRERFSQEYYSADPLILSETEISAETEFVARG